VGSPAAGLNKAERHIFWGHFFQQIGPIFLFDLFNRGLDIFWGGAKFILVERAKGAIVKSYEMSQTQLNRIFAICQASHDKRSAEQILLVIDELKPLDWITPENIYRKVAH